MAFLVAKSSRLAIRARVSLLVGALSAWAWLAGAWPSSGGGDESALAHVTRQCVGELAELNTVAEMRNFLEALKLVDEETLQALGKTLNRCRRSRGALLELEPLLETESVCDLHKVDRLLDYHQRHLMSSASSWQLATSLGRGQASKQTLARRLFERYAIQVAFSCKRHLAANLASARDELAALGQVLREARDKVYAAEPRLRANVRLLEEQPAPPPGANAKPQDEAELSLNQYREALTKIRRPEDVLTFERRQCLRSSSRYTQVAAHQLQTFFRPSLTCQRLQRYYAGSLLSIARLANAGYVARDEQLDSELDQIASLREWVLTVQVCEPLVHMSSTFPEGVKPGEPALVDTCSARVEAIEPLDYLDRLEPELGEDAERLDEMVRRSEASRPEAQKILRSAMRSVARVDIERQLKSASNNKRTLLDASLALLRNPSSSRHTQQQPAKRLANKMGACPRFSLLMRSDVASLQGAASQSEQTLEMPEKEAFEALKELVGGDPSKGGVEVDVETNDETIDSPVGFGDPVAMISSTLVVMAIMFTFEWVFFCVMTLAARLCHDMNFKLDNLLTFPPQFLSWSDADFATLSDKLDRLDEDDFFDYDELTPDEQHKRQLLSQVFGKPPPILGLL